MDYVKEMMDRQRKEAMAEFVLGLWPNAGKGNLAIFLSSTRWGNWHKVRDCLFHVYRPPLREPVLNLGPEQTAGKTGTQGACPLPTAHCVVRPKRQFPASSPTIPALASAPTIPAPTIPALTIPPLASALPSSPYHASPRELKGSLAPGQLLPTHQVKHRLTLGGHSR